MIGVREDTCGSLEVIVRLGHCRPLRGTCRRPITEGNPREHITYSVHMLLRSGNVYAESGNV